MTATERLRELLDERGADYRVSATGYSIDIGPYTTAYANRSDTTLDVSLRQVTPEQAIAATLGREPCVNPTWERWHKSLRHDEIKSIGDVVEQLMYEAIEFGGDMGPNGNTYNGIDEGDVLTAGFINEWVARFEATSGSGTCHDLAETPSYRDKTEFKCSECGYEYSAVGGFGCDSGDEPDFNFCPNCGRRVEVGE